MDEVKEGRRGTFKVPGRIKSGFPLIEKMMRVGGNPKE